MKFLFFSFFLCMDFATKIAAMHWIPPLSFAPYPFGGIGIFSFGGVTCSLNYTINTGAAWGLFDSYPGLLFAMRAVIIGVLIFFIPKRVPILLILAGAIGNALDYCLYGHVIDFIYFTFWGYSFPVFNVADSCISIGVLSLLFLQKDKQAQPI